MNSDIHAVSPAGRRLLLGGAGVALSVPWIAGPARAANDAKEIRVAFGSGLAYLPFYVGISRNLFADALREGGFGDVALSWPSIAGTSALNQAMLSGVVDFYVAGSPGVLIVWDRTRGRSNAILGCAGVTTLPLSLVTITDRIKSLTDIVPNDRIAMPSIVGTPATMIRMACEEAFGKGQHGRLDANLVSLAHPEAVTALLNDNGVTGYLSSPPFTTLVTDNPKGRVILRSPDVFKGPASFVLLSTRKSFAERNPGLVAAMIDGLERANAFIGANPRAAAETYLEREPSRIFTVDVIEAILRDPQTVYTTQPRAIGTISDFMVRTGEIKTKLASWKDIFVEQAHSLPGD